jgi:hypothetical protein
VNTVICIRPSVGDVWTSVSTSPFSNLALGGVATGFILSNLPAAQSSLTTAFTLAPSLLMNCSSLQRSIDIFSSPEFDGSKRITGTGGLEASADIKITLENSAHTIRLTKLIGRKIQIYVNQTDAVIRDPGHANNLSRFVGYIYSADGKRENVSLTCRGSFQSIKDTEIGTLSNYENDVFRAEIIPIVYGDFSDSLGFMPAVLNKNVGNLPDLIFGENPLEAIDSLLTYDAEAQKAYEMNLAGLTLNTDNTQVQLQESTGVYLVSAATAVDIAVLVWNPHTVQISFTAVATPLRVRTSSVAGTVYTSGGNFFECVELIDSLTYAFAVLKDTVAAVGDTFTYGSGAGTEPATLTVSTYFGVEKPEVNFAIGNELYATESTDLVATKPESQMIKLNDEWLFVKNTVVYETVGYYVGDYWFVVRGVNQTTAAAHAKSEIVSLNAATAGKISASHIFWPRAVHAANSVDSDSVDVINVDDSLTFDNDQSFKNLTAVHDQGLNENSVFSMGNSCLAQINLTAPAPDDWKKWFYFIDFEFEKITVDGAITNMYVVGGYKTTVTHPSMPLNGITKFEAGISFFRGGRIISLLSQTPETSALQVVNNRVELDKVAVANGGFECFRTNGYFYRGQGSFVQKPLSTTAIVESAGYYEVGDVKFIETTSVRNWSWLGDRSYLDGSGPMTMLSVAQSYNNLNVWPMWPDYTTDEHYWTRRAEYGFCNLPNASIGQYHQFALRAYKLFVTPTVKEYSIKTGNGEFNSLGYDAALSNLSELNKERLGIGLYGVAFNAFIGPESPIALQAYYRICAPGLLIDFTIDPLKTKIYARGQGVAGSTGVLSDPVSQLCHLLEHYVDPGMIGSRWDTKATQYLTEAVETAWQVTGTPQKCSQIIESICRENLLVITENGLGQLEIESLIPPSTAPTVTLTNTDILMVDDVTEIEEGATDLSQMTTQLTLRYQKNYADPEVYGSLADVTNVAGGAELFAEAETILDLTQPAHINMETVRKEATADKLFLYQGLWHNKAFGIYTFNVKWSSVVTNALRNGMWINITSSFLPNSASSYYFISETEEFFPMNDVAASMKLTVIEVPSDSYSEIDDMFWQDTSTVYGTDADITDVVTVYGTDDDVNDTGV